MGIFGGASQSTSSSSNILDFAPIFNIGDGITSSQRKTLDQTTSTSPKLDDSFGLAASVGVGVGGDGTAGPASFSRMQQEDTQPLKIKNVASNNADFEKYIPYALAVGGASVAYYLYKKNKK